MQKAYRKRKGRMIQPEGEERESLLSKQHLSSAWKLGEYGRLKDRWLL